MRQCHGKVLARQSGVSTMKNHQGEPLHSVEGQDRDCDGAGIATSFFASDEAGMVTGVAMEVGASERQDLRLCRPWTMDI